MVAHQRDRIEQERAAKPDAHTRARSAILAVALAVVAVIVIRVMIWASASTDLRAACRALYAQARTAADSARVDKVVPPAHAPMSCGAHRESSRRPA